MNNSHTTIELTNTTSEAALLISAAKNVYDQCDTDTLIQALKEGKKLLPKKKVSERTKRRRSENKAHRDNLMSYDNSFKAFRQLLDLPNRVTQKTVVENIDYLEEYTRYYSSDSDIKKLEESENIYWLRIADIITNKNKFRFFFTSAQLKKVDGNEAISWGMFMSVIVRVITMDTPKYDKILALYNQSK